MKKIGILTYYWSDNPGTFLQAYSTVQAFEKVFPDSRVELVACGCGKLKIHINRKAVLIYPLIKEVKRYFTYKQCQASHLKISPGGIVTAKRDEAIEYLKRQNYDLIVVGADTVFQLSKASRLQDNLPVYWVPPDILAKKVACATSCGALSFEELSEVQRVFCRQSLNAFELIGVRDDATLELVHKLGLEDERKIHKVPDPTFAYDIDYSFAESFVKKHNIDKSRPMLAILTQKSFQFASELADYYRKKGYIIVTLARLPCGDICLRDISPFEWAGLFKYFSFVVTDRFHGTVFSLKNKTPVLSLVCEPQKLSAAGKTKTRCLLEDFELAETNFVDTISMENFAAFKSVIEQATDAYDPEKVALRVKDLGKRYLDFIGQIRAI